MSNMLFFFMDRGSGGRERRGGGRGWERDVRYQLWRWDGGGGAVFSKTVKEGQF